jgi:hypothetical protein
MVADNAPAPGTIRKLEKVFGLDLGQAGDFSCLAGFDRAEMELVEEKVRVVPQELWSDPAKLAEWLEKNQRPKPKLPPVHYYGKLLRRYDVNTPYPDIVDHVVRIFEQPDFSGSALVIDGTGVGRPVVDLFRKAHPACKIVLVTITGGTAAAAKCDEFGYWHVSKRELVACLNMLMQTRRFQVDDSIDNAGVLIRELRNFVEKIKVTGNTSYEAWRESVHDDMVLASALALWYGERARRQFKMWF